MTSTNLLSLTSPVVVIICVVAIFRVSSLEVYTLHIWDILIIIKTLFLRPYPAHSVAAHGKVAPNKLHWNTSNKHVLLLEASQQHGGRYERRLVHAEQTGDGHVPHSGVLQVRGYKPFLIDTVQDLCAFSKQGNNLIQLGEMITRNIQEYLFNIQCPIEVERNTLIHFDPILINCLNFPGPTWDQGSSRESG